MYLDKKYYNTINIVVPQDLIIDPVNEMVLLVYLALYMMDNSSIDVSYNLPVTLKNVCDGARIFRNIQLRKTHYDLVYDAILWLADRKYIIIDNLSRKATAIFTYRTSENLKDVIKVDANGKKQQFVCVGVNELNALLSAMCLSDKPWKFCSDTLTAYMYLKLKQSAWQYKKSAKSIPAWAGYLNKMAFDLDISSHKISRMISWLKSVNMILPVYGVKEKSVEKISKTIIIFLLCCDRKNIYSIAATAQAVIREETPSASWYPVGCTTNDSGAIDEAALDVLCDDDGFY